MRVLALDLETGGTWPGRHGVVQVGMAIMEGDGIISQHESLVGPKLHWKTNKPLREYDIASMAISRIGWNPVSRAPQPVEVLSEIGDWLYAETTKTPEQPAHLLPLVSCNAQFDQGFWSDLTFLAGHYDPGVRAFISHSPILFGPWYCIRRMAWQLDLPNCRLGTIAKHYGLEPEDDAHGALNGAILAGKCFARMMEAK